MSNGRSFEDKRKVENDSQTQGSLAKRPVYPDLVDAIFVNLVRSSDDYGRSQLALVKLDHSNTSGFGQALNCLQNVAECIVNPIVSMLTQGKNMFAVKYSAASRGSE